MKGRRWLVLAFLLAGAVSVSLWLASRPSSSRSPRSSTAAVWQAPPRGQASAGFLEDGTPVLLVRHLDGGATAIEAVSPHLAWGIKVLLGWCPSSRTFDDPFHGSRFDEYGRYLAGPAPTGPLRLRTTWLPGSPPHIRLGAPLPALPREAPGVAPRGRFCVGATPVRAGLIMPDIAASGLTPPGLVKLAPPEGGRWSIRAVLLAGNGAPVRLCAAVLADGSCTDGVPVRGISQSLFARRPLLELRGVWLVLVDAGAFFDPIRAA